MVALPLASPTLYVFEGRSRRFCEYELLSSAEQASFRAKSQSEVEAGNLLEDHLPPGFDTVTQESLESVIFLAVSSRHIKDVLDHLEGGVPVLDVRDTRCSVLKQPIAFVEFRRVGKQYVSFAHGDLSDQRMRFNRAVGAFVQQYLQPIAQEIDDTLIQKRFDSLLAVNPLHLPGFAAQISDAAIREKTTPEARRLVERPELNGLCRGLADHVFRHYHIGPDASAAKEASRSNSFLRASVENWHRQLTNSSSTGGARNLTQGTGDYQTATEHLNALPYVAIEPLDSSPGTMFVCCVTASDRWFFDDPRIPFDVKLPGIVVGFFDIPDRASIGAADFRELEDALRVRLASVSARVMTHKRGLLLETAAGEAANISRYWFGEGVAKLLESNAGDGGLEREDVIEFWTRFIRDLLCAEIPNIRFTEIYPFDRAYIIRRTGANPTFLDAEGNQTAADYAEIRVLEAALQSDAPEDRFEYLTSSQRGTRSLQTDFNITKKRINHTLTLTARRQGSRIQISSGSVSGALVEQDGFALGDASDARSAADYSLLSLLGAIGTPREEASDQAENRIRKLFTEEGLLYEYSNGVGLANESPLLDSLDSAYRKILAKEIARSQQETPKTTPAHAANGKRTDSKVVTFAFEPTLRLDNRREFRSGGQAQPYYIGSSEAVTVILVQDQDVEKSVQDTVAERDDLQLLISIILRQKIRDQRRDVNFLEPRAAVIESVMDGLIHRIASELPNAARSIVNEQWDGLRRAIHFDRTALTQVSPIGNGEALLGKILAPGAEDVAGEIRRRVDDITRREGSRKSIKIRHEWMSTPSLEARLPLQAVRECFDVILKNAVEAALAEGAPSVPELVVSAGARPADRRWLFDVMVENTTAPVPPEVWEALTADKPVRLGENTAKKRSTGVGVLAARHLLQNGLGRRADIYYERLSDNRIRARITLPASELQAAGAKLVPAAHPFDRHGTSAPCDILYLEDRQEIREEGERFIAQAQVGLRVTVAGCKSAAEAAIVNTLPRLLISDLSVPLNEESKHPNAKHGIAFIKSFMTRGRERGIRPSIWIVSNSTSAEIETKFAGANLRLEEFDYSLSEGVAGRTVIEHGTITILPVGKDFSAYPILTASLQQLAAERTKPQADSAAPSPAPLPDGGLVAVTINFDELPALPNRLAAADRDAIHVVDATGADPAAALLNWITSEGAPDFEDSGHEERYSFWRSTIHHNIVLRLATGCFNALPLRSKYWLIRNNVAASELPIPAFARRWASLLNEPNGPISRLRHDIRNCRVAAVPAKIFEDIEHLTIMLDSALLPDSDTGRQFDQLVEQPSKSLIEDFFRTGTAGLASDLDRVANIARKLDAHMIELEQHTDAGSRRDQIADLRRSLAVVMEFLGAPLLITNG
jgi:hypothetical protein